MDVKELLGSAVKEAQKHPELLNSVVGFVKEKAGGSKPQAKKKPTADGATATAKRSAAKKDEGGLQGLLGDLDLAGLAEQAGSWVGTGPNERVSGEQVEKALGKKKVAAAARRAGVSERKAADGIAILLPAVVDYLTPDGKVPTKAQAAKRLETLEAPSRTRKEGAHDRPEDPAAR